MFSVGWWRFVLKSIPYPVIEVIRELKAHGFQGFLVGGAPRDLLLGKNPKDWDVATDALPAQVEEVFAEIVPVGRDFGTMQVLTGGMKIEVTTFRREGTYSDGRRPDWVEYTPSISDDLSRRDFTINAIAMDPLEKVLVDPFGGRRDLKRRLVRAVGDPAERFAEDALRMLRFYRFQSALNFRGEQATEEGVNPALIAKVSPERIRDELDKLLLSSYPGGGLRGMTRSGLLTEIIPEFRPLLTETGILEHLFTAVEEIKPISALRWAAFLHDVGKGVTKVVDDSGLHYYGHETVGEKIAAVILERLRFSREFQTKVLALIRWHMFPCDPQLTDAALRRLVTRVGRENIMDLLELRRADIIATGRRYHLAWEGFSRFSSRLEALLREEKVFTLGDLAVDGHDVMAALGLTPGPTVGEVLREVFQWVIEDPGRNTRERLLEFIREKYAGKTVN